MTKQEFIINKIKEANEFSVIQITDGITVNYGEAQQRKVSFINGNLAVDVFIKGAAKEVQSMVDQIAKNEILFNHLHPIP